jgi:hypothetical protein
MPHTTTGQIGQLPREAARPPASRRISLYVRASDTPLVERARAELGDSSLSRLFVDSLRQRFTDSPVSANLQRICLLVKEPQSGAVVRNTFTGEWLVGGADHGVKGTDLNGEDSGISWGPQLWSVARTQGGRLAVYARCEGEEEEFSSLDVYDNLDEMRAATVDSGRYLAVPGSVIAETAAALESPMEVFMDI